MALSGAEYGLKLGSQLFIKHIVESGLAAKGNSLQEGDLILKVWGPRATRHFTVGLIYPSLEGSSLASVTAGASHGCAGGSSVWCPLPAPAPLAVPGTQQGLSGCHVLLAQWGRVHPTVPTVCGPLLCVRVPTGRQSQRCLSGKMMLKVFGEEEIEGGRPFVCTPGPGRPVAAGSWCQGDSGANRRDNIPQSVGKSCYHSGRSQPQGLLGA